MNFKIKILWTFIFVFEIIQAQGKWTKKADFGGKARSSAIGFSIGNKGYIGTGFGSEIKKDLWEYDPASDIWTQKADFPGGIRYKAVGFSIGNKGYIGLGLYQKFSEAGLTGPKSQKDFWEYDPANNKWTKKADFPAKPHFNMTGLSIADKGYVVNVTCDFWEYEPSTNKWTEKKKFPGKKGRESMLAFSIDNKGFFGAGEREVYVAGSMSKVYEKDFWEYDPATDIWTKKAKVPVTWANSASFSINGKGYVAVGDYENKDFYEYDPVTDKWIKKGEFAGEIRRYGSGFSIGDKGYVGIGSTGKKDFEDFWEWSEK